MANTAPIIRVLKQTERRARLLAALDGAALGIAAAGLVGIAALFLNKVQWMGDSTSRSLLWIAAGIATLTTLRFVLERPRELVLANLLDSSAKLADRITNARAFEKQLANDKSGIAPESLALMEAAIADGVRAATKADPKLALPLRVPRDFRAAVGVMAIAGILSTIDIPPRIRAARLTRAFPPLGTAQSSSEVQGANLCNLPVPGEAEGSLSDGDCEGARSIATIEFENGTALELLRWEERRIVFQISQTPTIGLTKLILRDHAGRMLDSVDFEILDTADPRLQTEDTVEIAEEDLEYTRDLVKDLSKTAERTQDPHLRKYADEINKLLDKADKGQISKQELLEELNKAEKEYMKGSEDSPEESLAELARTGKELKKNKMTKALGQALEKGDLNKAKQELEKLAQQLEKGELSKKQKQQLSKALEEAGKKFEERTQKQEKQLESKIQRKQKEESRLKKKMQEAKTEKEKRRLQKKIDKNKRELKKLQRKKQQQKQSKNRRNLKQLHRKLREASKDMKSQNQQQQQKSQQEASRKMRDIARETGKVDLENKKLTNQKKMASQMEDLREALRRAKRKGKGMKNNFGKNQRNRDFKRRAQGKKGSRSAWKSGKAGGKKQGQGQPGSKQSGQQMGGNEAGDQHDPNIMGDETARTKDTQDESVSGRQGNKGPSVRETIISAAQKGFASTAYKKVRAQYEKQNEEVLKAEKIPLGYKHYVKKYLQRIKPRDSQ